MKKTIPLLLAFVLCLSLCACGESKSVVESPNYIGTETTSTLPMESLSIETEATEDVLTLETMAWVCNEWVAYDGTTMTIHDNNTCEIGGETLTWVFESISEGRSCDIDVFDGEMLRFQLSFWTMNISENGVEGEESVVAVYPIGADGVRGSQTNYSLNSEWNKVEITAENWQDYIELCEVAYFQTNDFGDKTVSLGYLFRYKNGIYVREESSASIELAAESATRSIAINADEETYVIGDTISTFGGSETIITLQGNDTRTFGSAKLTMEDTEITLPNVKEYLRAAGTIYIFVGE